MKPFILLQQERDFGQKINVTFQFIVQNFRPLMTALIYIAVPFSLLSLIIGLLLMGTISSVTSSFSKISNFSFVSPFYFLTLFLGMISFVITNLTTCGYIVEYEKGNTHITPSNVWVHVKNTLLNGIGALFLTIICVIIGLLLIIIPGYYLVFCFPIIFMVLVRENNGVVNSLKRCIELTDSPWWSPIVGSILFIWLLFFESIRLRVRNWWSTFVLMALMAAIYYLSTILLMLPALLMGFAGSLKIMSIQSSSPLYILGAVFANVVGTLLSSIIPIAAAMQYYNFVAKKEGSDLVDEIENIGKNDTPRIDRREEDF